MLNEVLEICNPANGGNFIDCTFGYGGYSNAILSYPKTKVIALDRDLHTKEYALKTKKFIRIVFHFTTKNLVSYQALLIQRQSLILLFLILAFQVCKF